MYLTEVNLGQMSRGMGKYIQSRTNGLLCPESTRHRECDHLHEHKTSLEHVLLNNHKGFPKLTYQLKEMALTIWQ